MTLAVAALRRSSGVSTHHWMQPRQTQKWQRQVVSWRMDGVMVARPSQSVFTVQWGDSDDASRSRMILPQLSGQRKLAHLRREPIWVRYRELSSMELGLGKVAQRVVAKRVGVLRRKRSRKYNVL